MSAEKVVVKKVRSRKPVEPALVILSGKERVEDDHGAILGAIIAGRQNPHGLVLVFRGEGVLSAWPALELSDRLREIKAEGKRVVTVAECWLGAPDLLVWLEGTTRVMTPAGDGHVKVPSYSRHHVPQGRGRKGEFRESLPELEEYEESDEAKTRERKLNDPRGYAYEQMLERLNEYLPVKEYENKVVTRSALVEMGLITGEGLDKAMETPEQAKDKPAGGHPRFAWRDGS